MTGGRISGKDSERDQITDQSAGAKGETDKKAAS